MKTTKGFLGIGLVCWAFSMAACGGGTPAPAPAGPAPAAPAAAPAPSGVSVVTVEMTWDGPKDMDLEIWDAAGEDMILRSFFLSGTDQTSGGTPETFEFKKYDSGNFPEQWTGSRNLDYAQGVYTVSAYFHERSASQEATTVVLRVKKPDGSTEERRRKIEYERGKDQWHAFTVDAATGVVTDVDKFVTIRETR